jgi:CBS domain-containing protein
MQLREIMSHKEKMRGLDVGSLPVCQDDRLIGMVTDRDITIRGIAEGRQPDQTSVQEVMTGEVVSVLEDQDVEEAANLMEERQIRRLPVVDHEQRLVGIVSLGDLAVYAGDTRLSGEVLERVSEPTD